MEGGNDAETIQLCTVTANGRRYIIDRIEVVDDDPAKSFVHTHGELFHDQGRTRRDHGPGKRFRMDKVTVDSATVTVMLLDALCSQRYIVAQDDERMRKNRQRRTRRRKR